MARDWSTISTWRWSGFGPAGCQWRTRSIAEGFSVDASGCKWWRFIRENLSSFHLLVSLQYDKLDAFILWFSLPAHERNIGFPGWECFSRWRESVLYWQPTGPNPLNHRDNFSRQALRHGCLNFLFQVVLYLPSYEGKDLVLEGFRFRFSAWRWYGLAKYRDPL